jgi:hypothetical protein
MVHEMIDEFGKDKYIVNLGHGILPNIPVDHCKHLSMQWKIQPIIADAKQRIRDEKKVKIDNMLSTLLFGFNTQFGI